MVTFDYGKLASLADEARKAERESNRYADDLDRKIRDKISNYSGEHTGNINTAYDHVRWKANQLRQKAGTLHNYASRVDSFRSSVINSENRLASRIGSLMGSFKKKWNIKEPSKWEKAAEWFCDLIGLGDLYDKVRDFLKDLNAYIKHIFNEISDWYHFKGGAEFIDAVVAIYVAVVLVVIDVVLIFCTGGAWAAVKIVMATLVAIIAAYNAYGKVRQYLETANKSHVLHKSANNKIASETDYASWLRRNGRYEDANAFEIAEFAVTVANVILNIVEFGKNAINVIRSQASGNFFQNIAKSMKNGWAKSLPFKQGASTKDTLKFVKNLIKIYNGTYSMMRTNNFGKTTGKAVIDTIKAGKDTWDTLIKIGLENIWTFEYFDGTVDKKTQVENTGVQKMRDLFFDYPKDGVTAYNKYMSAQKHKSLSLNNFKYDPKLAKQSDYKWKGWANLGSESKMITGLAEWLKMDNFDLPSWMKTRYSTGFNLKYGPTRLPLGAPLYSAAVTVGNAAIGARTGL